MSEVKVNKLSPRSGTTVTLGDSGDTISIPSGVTLDASSGGLAGTLTTAAQPNITSVGTLTSFTSTGIDDNATSTAITIDSSERVSIRATSTTRDFQVGDTSGATTMEIESASDSSGTIFFGDAQSGASGRILYDHTDNYLRLDTNGSERMRIDSSGNVGIGTSSPGRQFEISSANPYLSLKSTDTSTGTSQIFFGDTSDDNVGRISYGHDSNAMLFLTNASEAMRIDSSGNVLVGTTTFNSDAQNLPTDSLAIRQSEGRLLIHSSAQPLELARTFGDTSTRDIVQFYREGSFVGKIQTNGSSTSYVTSSDYRLKENVSYDFDATTRLKQLKPARFNFIEDANTTVDGFLAHEVSNIVPEAISGTHNETETKEKVVVSSDGNIIAENIEQADWETGKIADENGNTQYPTDSTWEATKVVPVYQGIDQAKLVPLLVKTIQELEARITTLENA